MSLLKSVERLKRIDYFIKNESTGISEEFAKKIGISRSMLMENLQEMKDLGADIVFCQYKRSYHYTNNFSIVIGALEKIKGGEFFLGSPMASDT